MTRVRARSTIYVTGILSALLLAAAVATFVFAK
jgi:hypothetical protein